MISLHIPVEMEDTDPIKERLRKFLSSPQLPFPFMELPFDREEIKRMKEAKDNLKEREVRNFVILGIGGSSLGTSAIFNALLPPFYNLSQKGPRYYILDNIDPESIKEIYRLLEPEIDKTLFLVVSKSGETTETLSQFMIFKELQSQKNVRDRFFVITGEKGTLRKIAEKEGYPVLHIPQKIGGRFSVLTACGLFPSLLMNIDIERILEGARNMANHIGKEENLALELASLIYLLVERGKKILVIMPYSDRLRLFSDWLIQLFSESLGKAGKGFTPLGAKGVTDQHSLLQLFLDGPKDKALLFFFVETESIKVPDVFSYVSDLDHLRGKELKEIFEAEFHGTRLAVKEASVPYMTVHIKRLDPFSLGALFFLFEMVTVLLGHLFDVNPFDQEAVELGKRYTKALLGKKGFEEEKKKIEESKGERILSFA